MEQIAKGVRMTYEYTPLGQLSRKTLWDTKGKTLASLNYIHGKDGKIMGRTVNGKSQHFQYDQRNQLVAVLDGESKEILERYNYDPAGNILKKTVLGKTTSYTYDRANQLVQSMAHNGQTTDYSYDAAGRMIKEGAKSYTYGYMDKVMSVFENGQELASFEYDQLGQISKVIRPGGEENFVWDGLALIARNDIDYVNDPHEGGGNPVLAGDGLVFNDFLGTSMGDLNKDNEYTPSKKTAFGSTLEGDEGFFTGKPFIKELGHSFLFRNYRSDLGKWQIQDLIGYPDGWNNLAYCNNDMLNNFDYLGALTQTGEKIESFDPWGQGMTFQVLINYEYDNNKNSPALTLKDAQPYGNTEQTNNHPFQVTHPDAGGSIPSKIPDRSTVSFTKATATATGPFKVENGEIKIDVIVKAFFTIKPSKAGASPINEYFTLSKVTISVKLNE